MTSLNYFAVSFSFLFFLTCLKATNSLIATDVGNFSLPICTQNYYYDGQSDTIYLFGGIVEQEQDYTSNLEIYAFSITDQSITTVGKIPESVGLFANSPVFLSSSLSDSSHLILYYLVPQLEKDSTLVFLFNATDGTSTEIAPLHLNIEFASFASSLTRDEVYFFGGPQLKNNILKAEFNGAESVTHNFVGKIQQSFENNWPSAATFGNTAFVFGGKLNESTQEYPYITLDLETLESSNPKSTFPDFLQGVNDITSVVTTKDSIYIMGGYEPRGKTEIIRMDPATQTYEALSIENGPLIPEHRWTFAPTGVWVEKQNRIYFFGGVEGPYFKMITWIWYIQLE